jgi:hypothetical protein
MIPTFHNPLTQSDGISLREYIDVRINEIQHIMELDRNDVEKRISLYHGEIEKRTEFARMGMEKRLDAMNEFRNALKDQAVTFPTKSEMNVILRRLEEDVRSLRETRAELHGKASTMAMWGAYIFNVITIIIAIIALIT